MKIVFMFNERYAYNLTVLGESPTVSPQRWSAEVDVFNRRKTEKFPSNY